MGADVVGRDLGPRVSSALHSGLTADCTALEIGPHDDKKLGRHYDELHHDAYSGGHALAYDGDDEVAERCYDCYGEAHHYGWL